MKRKLISLLIVTAILLVTFNFSAFSQSGQKWSTGGNSLNSGDYLGSSNNQPLMFKVNNALALYIKPDGNVFVSSLSNGSNGIVSYNDSGMLTPLSFPNDETKVFLGNGTWGSIPIPQNYWQFHDPDIYTMTPGNIGIGITHPLFKLDVDGDVRISQNLYVGGGIIITDKVNATTEVNTGKIYAAQELKSAALKADSIIMDSTKAFYGESNFNGDVKLKYKLDVTGDVQVNGNFRTAGNLIFANNKTIGYLPSSGGNPDIIYYGTSPQQPITLCYSTSVPFNQFSGLLQSTGLNNGNLNVMTVGFNGTNGIIDVAGNSIQPSNAKGLLINYYCGKDVSICTGNNGGNVFLTSIGNVGIGTIDPHAKLHVLGNTIIGMKSITTGPHSDFQLAVDGKLVARKIITTEVNWADDELQNNLTFSDLENEEIFIKINSHLKGIPSGKEVEKNGIDVGVISSLQMRKIEQLFIYMFLMKKENDLLKQKISELEEKIQQTQN